VPTAWYGIDRPVQFSKSHWYSLSLPYPFCSDIFSPPVLCQSSNHSYIPMNIIMYKAQTWDLTKCKLFTQYTRKKYWHFRFSVSELWHNIHKYFRGTLKLKIMVADSYETLVSSSKSTHCHSPKDHKLCTLHSVNLKTYCILILCVFNQTVSNCLAFTSYRNFSFHSERQKEGE
jgi:hypothetical protein